MQKITPCLWFNGNVDQAIKLYTSVFKNSKIKDISHYPASSPIKPGEIMVAVFEIENQEYMILNAGPQHPFTEAISFIVNCENQPEVDHYWNSLLENGGKADQCGWLKDPYGVSWQIVPTVLGKLMASKDPKKASNVMQAMMQMKKLDIAKLEEAYNK